MQGTIETYLDEGRWRNRRVGREEAPFGDSDSLSMAKELGRAAALREGAEHIVRGRDGRIQRSTSYANSAE